MFKKKRVIAVFGGSFDPPTRGHIEVIREVLHRGWADEIVVCPTYKHRDKGDQGESFKHRLMMCELAFSQFPQVKVSSAEWLSYYNLSRIPDAENGAGVGSTFYLMAQVRVLQQTGGLNEYRIIVGQDCFKNLKTWFQSKYLMDHYKFIVIPRPMADSLGNEQYAFDQMDLAMFKAKKAFRSRGPGMDISSTQVRDFLRTRSYVEYLDAWGRLKEHRELNQLSANNLYEEAIGLSTRRVVDYAVNNKLYTYEPTKEDKDAEDRIHSELEAKKDSASSIIEKANKEGGLTPFKGDFHKANFLDKEEKPLEEIEDA